MCNDEQIVLLPFEFEYDGLEPDCKIVVRLEESAQSKHRCGGSLTSARGYR